MTFRLQGVKCNSVLLKGEMKIHLQTVVSLFYVLEAVEIDGFKPYRRVTKSTIFSTQAKKELSSPGEVIQVNRRIIPKPDPGWLHM